MYMYMYMHLHDSHLLVELNILISIFVRLHCKVIITTRHDLWCFNQKIGFGIYWGGGVGAGCP